MTFQISESNETRKTNDPILMSGLKFQAHSQPCDFVTSVTRLGDLLHFEQLFKAFGNN